MPKQIADMFAARVNQNFFNLLTGKNQSFYAYCILTLYDQSTMSNSADFDRGRVNFIISDCMEVFRDRLAGEEIEEEPSAPLTGQERISRSLPLTKELVFYRLRNCGWLDVEIDETHRQLISFTLGALQIMPALIKMSRPARASLGGYTRNIIDNLSAVKTSKHPF